MSFCVCIGHMYIFFGEMSIQVLYPFFNQVVVELYEFFICSSPYQMYDLQVLSSIVCFFILLIMSFDVQVFNFDEVQLTYFFFLLMLFVSYPRNHFQTQCHEVFALCFLVRVL